MDGLNGKTAHNGQNFVPNCAKNVHCVLCDNFGFGSEYRLNLLNSNLIPQPHLMIIC